MVAPMPSSTPTNPESRGFSGRKPGKAPGERATRRLPSPRIEAWGLLSYDDALARQLEVWERRARGEGEDVIAVVEHPSVVTLGRNAPMDDVLVDPAGLAREGVALVRSDRGGRATYHGPGQAVIYPIVATTERGLGVKQWVTMLEHTLMETLRRFGVEGRTIDDHPGIWVGHAKIASIGLRVARGVSYHGVSINVESRAKQGFDLIVTCGVAGQEVTSLEDHVVLRTCGAGRSEPVTVGEAAAVFCSILVRRLQAHGNA